MTKEQEQLERMFKATAMTIRQHCLVENGQELAIFHLGNAMSFALAALPKEKEKNHG